VIDTPTKSPVDLILLFPPAPPKKLTIIRHGGWVPSVPPINTLNSSCGEEILKPLEGIFRQMIVLPSQLNGAEHPSPENHDIPLVPLVAYPDIVEEHWFKTYVSDNTGGPIGQLRGSLEVAREVVRLSEADTEGRRPGDIKDHLPVNYVKYVSNHLPEDKRGQLRVVNGYLTTDALEMSVAEKFIQNMDKMTLLMSVNNPASGIPPPPNRERERMEVRQQQGLLKQIDMVYASAMPLNGAYGSPIQGSPYYEATQLVGLNLIFNQYRIALTQACKLAEDIPIEAKYQVLLMPLGGGVFQNTVEDISLAVQHAIYATHTLHGFSKLDIKMLFFNLSDEEALFKAVNAGNVFTK
jgi:hypothetical protein